MSDDKRFFTCNSAIIRTLILESFTFKYALRASLTIIGFFLTNQ